MIAINTTMMEITTSNSMSVNPRVSAISRLLMVFSAKNRNPPDGILPTTISSLFRETALRPSGMDCTGRMNDSCSVSVAHGS
jgi:hypothetical protein